MAYICLTGKFCLGKGIKVRKARLGLVGCCHDYITQVKRQFGGLLIVPGKTELFAISVGFT